MKRKTVLKSLAIFTLLLSYSCDDDLDECYETICDGPNNTNCREEPKLNSSCFPNGNTEFKD